MSASALADTVRRRLLLVVGTAAVAFLPFALFAPTAAAWHPTCQKRTSLNFRFHYLVQQSNGSWTSGSWSATTTVICPGNGKFAHITIGPQGWGPKSVTSSTPLIVGYTVTAPGVNTPVNVTVVDAKVTFPVNSCTITKHIPDHTFSVTGGGWAGTDYQTTVGSHCGTSVTLDQATFSANVG